MEQSAASAFVSQAVIEPTGSGVLNGLTFAVKDLIDLAGLPTGAGSPAWRDSHPLPAAHAVCVEQLLAASGRCLGKTITDELAFSLIGENPFYGTPCNPKAPDRVPGGSSSGSASAVACGLVDFALGTDTGGSVRVPASNCGILGFRPTHAAISTGGVLPFAPSFDTVGLLAADPQVLCRAGSALLGTAIPDRCEVAGIHLLAEAFQLADQEVSDAVQAAVAGIGSRLGLRVRSVSLGPEVSSAEPGGSLAVWRDTYNEIQWAEIWSSLGGWFSATKPELSRFVAQSLTLTQRFERPRVARALRRRQLLSDTLDRLLGSQELVCLPTVHTPPPLKGCLGQKGFARNYFSNALALTAIAGISGTPAVSLPLAEVCGLPVGLCLIAARGNDSFLLAVARQLFT